MDITGKKVSVLGLGRSGVAVSKLLISKGARVFASDAGNPDVKIEGLSYETGKHSERIFDSELIVLSPGISMNHEVVKKARKRGIEVLGEIEVAAQFFSGKMIAVTGTNGKTTTCALIGEMLKKGGFKVEVGGNIFPGKPLSEVVLNVDSSTIIVVEVSTFQLETIKEFKPFICVITNITPDHLDRHGDFETYTEIKRKIFMNQKSGDYCILNYDDKVTKQSESLVKSNIYFFSIKNKLPKGVFLDNDNVVFKNKEKKIFLMNRNDILLIGEHNLENVLAASLASILVGCDEGAIAEAAKNFSGVPHRLEPVLEINGIKFINNSMCTNPVAFRRSIESVETPFVLICGGRNKNLAIEKMVNSILKAKYTVLIGESAEAISQYLRKVNYNHFSIAGTMDEATEIAYEHAVSGDTVLLSPGGSSFDMFRDFADRGNRFKKSVKRLKE